MEIVPRLEKSICSRCPRIGGRREIHRKPRGQGGRKQINHRWPSVDQLIYYFLMKGPFRPDHLIGATEGVRCDIERAHDELGQETDMAILRPKEYLPSCGVQSGRERSARTTKIGDCGGVVAEQCYRQAHQQMF